MRPRRDAVRGRSSASSGSHSRWRRSPRPPSLLLPPAALPSLLPPAGPAAAEFDALRTRHEFGSRVLSCRPPRASARRSRGSRSTPDRARPAYDALFAQAAAAGMRLQPMFGFDAAPTATTAGAWAARFGPGGTFWASRARRRAGAGRLRVRRNENSYTYAPKPGRGSAAADYARSFKKAYDAIKAANAGGRGCCARRTMAAQASTHVARPGCTRRSPAAAPLRCRDGSSASSVPAGPTRSAA